MIEKPTPSLDLAFLNDGGEMGALMRAHDWAATPLGPLDAWPQSLRSAASIMLNSRYPIALYWGPDLALLYNDDWAPILGGKHPWALGRAGREVWPEIWDTIGPLYERVFATGEGVWQEDELLPMNRHGSLEEYYYNFTFSPVRGADGRIDGIFNAVVETTDRVLSERRLRTLSRMGERGDPELGVESACAQAIDVLGENTADVPFALVYLREDGTARLVAAAGVQAGSAAAPATLSIERPDHPVWPLAAAEAVEGGLVIAAPEQLDLPRPVWPEPVAEVIVLPVVAAGAMPASAFLVAGVSPRRRIDPGYLSFFQLAAGHVATAITTARAYGEERRRAEALAELDRAKTQFFSNVSHEFRTPLTLMLGPLEDALAEAGPHGPNRERLDLAHRNALRLQRLVNALLDFSRIEAGRTQAAFRATDLAAATEELASSFRTATDKAGLTLDIDAAPLSQPAYVDRGMWETIVLNLVSNAFKFTQEGGIKVAVREADGAARLTVADTGAGIPAHQLPRLFERFHRVEGAAGRSFEGSGIGLALVKELVALHDGDVAVESEEGVGSRFTVTIPLGTDHLPAPSQAGAADGDGPTTRAQAFVEEALRWLPDEIASVSLDAAVGGSVGNAAIVRRVLLADDNSDLRGYIARLLAEHGYAVEAVVDGEAALAAARSRRPDLLVTDVMMPRLDGFGLLRAVRADDDLRDLPVIMLSARAGEEAKVEGFDAGADDYLTKPFSARELLARVSATIALAELRREVAAAVMESEARFRNMADHAPCMMWVTDASGCCTYLNRAWYEFTGQARAEAEGFGWLDATHPEDRADAERVFLDANARHAGFRVEYRLRRTDGSYHWAIDAAAPRFGADGGFLGYIGSVIDIHDRKTAEEALELRIAEALAERKLLADLVEGTDAFVQVAGPDFRWLAINKAAADEFERIYGVRPRVGDSMLDLLAHKPEHQAAVRAAWSRALAGEEFTETGEFGDPALDTRCYEMKYNVLRGAGGAQIGAYQFVYDVTDRVHEHRRLAEAEEALRQSRKMEAMGQLTGGVAHDFNNLLTPIVGALDMLNRKGLGGEREQRLIAGAAQSAERAKLLVQRLLAFARRQPLQAVGVDVAGLIAGMADLISSTTGPQIKVVVEVAESLPCAKADPNQLEMALLNLAVNARDAMIGGGTLRITASEAVVAAARPDLRPGRYVRLSVADTGTGMDEATRQRAIEPFFSTKGVGKGTGLGLSMVHGLASQLGGTLEIRSTPGLGTNIELWLPEGAEGADAGSQVVEAPETAACGTALLVDDEDLVRLSTADMLGDLGYDVLEASTAEQGLAIVQNGTDLDLVVTDHLMPGMTGTDLARAVQTLRPGVPILVISGYAESEGVEPDLPRLTKPFRKDELAASLAALKGAAHSSDMMRDRRG